MMRVTPDPIVACCEPFAAGDRSGAASADDPHRAGNGPACGIVVDRGGADGEPSAPRSRNRTRKDQVRPRPCRLPRRS
ncbi:hypothetical protein FM125_04275 [Micrococcus lylae]|uniref:Uncharacterized protein n=1 Tax=Micrococcus lylae TaxID=1273 RepID=A0A1R4IS40_9MICC|nr:hypothetical protein FM125_04275 [Micrococcus lylae]